jgi:hypothetical protein
MGRVRKTFFNTVTGSPDTVCSLKSWFSCLSGHQAAMFGQATFTYATVSTVTRHGFWLSQPGETPDCGRPFLSWPSTRYGQELKYTPASTIFLQAPAHFPTVGHSSYQVRCWHSVAIQTYSAIFECLLLVSFQVSRAGHFLSPFRRCIYAGSGLLLHSSGIPIVLRSFVGCGAIGSLERVEDNFSGPDCYKYGLKF